MYGYNIFFIIIDKYDSLFAEEIWECIGFHLEY